VVSGEFTRREPATVGRTARLRCCAFVAKMGGGKRSAEKGRIIFAKRSQRPGG
jgi:hypothetical protein